MSTAAVDRAKQGTGQPNDFANSLGLLSALFNPGFPSITGGHAGPSAAESEISGWVIFNNPFSVSGEGDAVSTASPSSNAAGLSTNNLILAGLGLAAVLMISRL